MIRLIRYWNNKELELENILEVGDGWKPIVERLYDDLVKLGWDKELHQVKEKFGSLRFYIGYGSDEMYSRISQAEEESMRTCEVCGNPGKISGKYWLKCTCEFHTND